MRGGQGNREPGTAYEECSRPAHESVTTAFALAVCRHTPTPPPITR
ncbi:hypothetical protein K227x_17230 [Rubripirellula lacrimiformis]|uniref:Uncharacterized protein n=1 Tax=Rubripirellula lacrimiformis TaxID=1930273 RepID=A0A517N884_9BACT|nr:hypothetical protein K227x_17230 [Rubripirellula lacrimiformis]